MYLWLHLNEFNGGGKFSIEDILTAFVINNQVIPYGGIQWFLTSLFFTELIFVVLRNIFKQKTVLLFVCVCFYLFGFMKLEMTDYVLPFSIDTTFFALPAFAFGVIFKDWIVKSTILNQWYSKVLAIVLLAIPFFVDGYSLNMRTCSYGPWWILIVGIIISLLIMLLIKEYETRIVKFKYYSLIREIGQNTITLLLLNALVRKLLMFNHLPTDNYILMISEQIIGTIIVISIITFISRWINKHCPYLLGKF